MLDVVVFVHFAPLMVVFEGGIIKHNIAFKLAEGGFKCCDEP